MIYFVQGTHTKLIKIGTTRNDLAARFSNFMLSEEITVLRTIDGSYEDERQWHRRFAKDNVHGEWFTPTPELVAAITALPLTPLAGTTFIARPKFSMSIVGRGESRLRVPRRETRRRRGSITPQHPCSTCRTGLVRNPGAKCKQCFLTHFHSTTT